VLQKGKVTIPAEMREALGVEEGDYVTVDLEDGRLVISATGTIANPTEIPWKRRLTRRWSELEPSG